MIEKRYSSSTGINKLISNYRVHNKSFGRPLSISALFGIALITAELLAFILAIGMCVIGVSSSIKSLKCCFTGPNKLRHTSRLLSQILVGIWFGTIGATKGATIGAIIGSGIPGVGTIIGATIGTVFGAIYFSAWGAGAGALISKYLIRGISWSWYSRDPCVVNPSNPEKYNLQPDEKTNLNKNGINPNSTQRALKALRFEKNKLGFGKSIPGTADYRDKNEFNRLNKDLKKGTAPFDLMINGEEFNLKQEEKPDVHTLLP